MEKGNLNEAEKNILESISTGTIEEVKAMLNETGVRINCLDDSGMTFLQHAAFRGKSELCELLLAHGADVNSNHHDNNYSTLMFAALSGNVDTTKMILEAGANVNHENNLGRTATQMAAFVGQHACVTLINNFLPLSELEYYTQPQGFETEGKLPTHLLQPLYSLLNTSNLHPVHITRILDKQRGLVEEQKRVTKVLDLICERSMKDRETKDVKALKAHYLSRVISRAAQALTDRGDLDRWCRTLVKGRDSDGFPENQELFIRGTLKDFPYLESQLLQQLIRNIAPVTVGNEPTALSMLMSGINGQQFFKDEESACVTCGQGKAPKKCSVCKMVNYCDPDCQKLHWSTHKRFCQKLAVQYKRIQEEKEREAQLNEETKTQQVKLDKDTKTSIESDADNAANCNIDPETKDPTNVNSDSVTCDPVTCNPVTSDPVKVPES